MGRRLGLRLLMLGLGVLVAGCGGAPEPEGDKKADDGSADPAANVMAWPEGTKTSGGEGVKLVGATDVNLAELLNRPRAELAAQADECLDSIKYYQDLHMQGKLPFLLLPEVHVPLAVPVLHQAKFSARLGFSVPPYLAEDRKDTELALHLARHGDVEAAQRLVDPTDADAAKRLAALRLERNYPVEWVRLVGLLLHRAQYKLLPGNVDECKQLIGLHQQLDKLLTGKARSSPLGVDLLARGRVVLQQAAEAWRRDKQEHLAEQALAYVRDWGEVPGLSLPWQLPVARARAEFLFATRSTGKLLNAPAPLRVLDLLGLALPDDGLENIVGTLDAQDRLEEILVLYGAGQDEVYGRPEALAFVLVESMKPQPEPTAAKSAEPFQVRAYNVGDTTVDASLVRHNPTVGALVRVHARRKTQESSGVGNVRKAMRPGTHPEPAETFLPRDFGSVTLDRSFEQNRRRVALHKRANRITIESSTALKQVQGPVTALPLSEIILERAKSHDVLAAVLFHYNPRKGQTSLANVAGPLWARGGTARISGGKDLYLDWSDEKTSYHLSIPNRRDGEVALQVVNDWTQDEWENLEARVEAVRAHDRAERRARFESRQPWMRLPRDLENIKLGMTRDEVQRVLPPDFKAFKRAIPQGILVTMTGEAPRSGAAVPREFSVQFDASGRVAEVRVRYQTGADPAGLAKLVAALEKRGGAPLKAPGSWAQTWIDLPVRKPAPILRHWQDDVTRLTCQQDAAGLELSLRACTLAHEEGVPLPPLQYLPRGPEDCLLGTAKDALLRHWKVATPVLVDGAVVLAPKAPSAFDALLVWFQEDRAVHIVARHKTKDTRNPAEAARSVREAWTQEARSLGLPWRQDFAEDGSLQGWTTQDDRTRVRIFWQQRNDGMLGVFSEWRDLARP